MKVVAHRIYFETMFGWQTINIYLLVVLQSSAT